jgi:hypothetical protein
MTAQDRATAREAAPRTDRADGQYLQGGRADSPGMMAQQSGPGYEAAPQAFVRLSGSRLAKPRVSRELMAE